MSFVYAWEEEAIVSILLTLLTGVPSGAFGVVCYVLRSLALYTMAQRRQIQKAWLAWVPVLSCWILGSLSDQYRYVAKGQIKSKRKWLLWLSILQTLLGVFITVMTVYTIAMLAGSFGHPQSFYELRPLAKPVLWILFMAIPMAGVGIAIAVFRFMALYDVYVSVEPNNAVLFLVLSILFKIVEPFFLFFNRDKDLGMPPRRDAAPAPEETWEPENKDYL